MIKFSINKSPTKPEDIEKKLTHGFGLTKKLMTTSAKDAAKAEKASLEASLEKAAVTQEARNEIEAAARAEANVLALKTPTALDYDEYQSAAITGLSTNKHGCLIGAAGTGKTTITLKLIEEIEKTVGEITLEKAGISGETNAKIYSILCCSFTGRAVQQQKRALPRKYHKNCMTIHKALGYRPVEEEVFDEVLKCAKMRKVFRPLYTEFNKMPWQVIVIDESSMVPINLFNELVAASQPNTRFMLVGDINQLPPVQSRSVLPFAMLQWPTYELKKIHRQAEGNPIIAAAHSILNGQFPKQAPPRFSIKPLPDGQVSASSYTLKFVKAMHKANLFNPLNDALIVPVNKDTMGQLYLNEDLSNYFNPPEYDTNKVELNRRHSIKAARGHRMLAIKDKVMLLENDNDLGLTNGMIGVVVDITINGGFRGFEKYGIGEAQSNKEVHLGADLFDEEDEDDAEGDNYDEKEKVDDNQRQASHITTVKFSLVDGEQEVKFQTVGQYNKLAHAYAFTCHKSQGGEYPTVVIAMHASAAGMLCREWLYTAVTRARERVVLLCNDRALVMALQRQAITGRTLAEKANSFIAFMDDKDKTKPNLPKNEVL